MSQYAQRMARLAASICREVSRPTDQKSMKVVKMFSEKPAHLNPEIVDYYPPYKKMNRLMVKLRMLGLYRDEHADFVDNVKKQKMLKGKVKPKKGEGKRTTRRK